MAPTPGSPEPAPDRPPGSLPATPSVGARDRLPTDVGPAPAGGAVGGVTATGGVLTGTVGTAGGSVALPLEAVRQRVPLTLDPLGADLKTSEKLDEARIEAVANLFTGMAQIHIDLGQLVAVLDEPSAPANLIAVLVQP